VEFEHPVSLETLGEASKFKVVTGWRDGRDAEADLSFALKDHNEDRRVAV